MAEPTSCPVSPKDPDHDQAQDALSDPKGGFASLPQSPKAQAALVVLDRTLRDAGFDVSCLDALDEQLLRSPTDCFSDICWAAAVQEERVRHKQDTFQELDVDIIDMGVDVDAMHTRQMDVQTPKKEPRGISVPSPPKQFAVRRKPPPTTPLSSSLSSAESEDFAGQNLDPRKRLVEDAAPSPPYHEKKVLVSLRSFRFGDPRIPIRTSPWHPLLPPPHLFLVRVPRNLMPEISFVHIQTVPITPSTYEAHHINLPLTLDAPSSPLFQSKDCPDVLAASGVRMLYSNPNDSVHYFPVPRDREKKERRERTSSSSRDSNRKKSHSQSRTQALAQSQSPALSSYSPYSPSQKPKKSSGVKKQKQRPQISSPTPIPSPFPNVMDVSTNASSAHAHAIPIAIPTFPDSGYNAYLSSAPPCPLSAEYNLSPPSTPKSPNGKLWVISNAYSSLTGRKRVKSTV